MFHERTDPNVPWYKCNTDCSLNQTWTNWVKCIVIRGVSWWKPHSSLILKYLTVWGRLVVQWFKIYDKRNEKTRSVNYFKRYERFCLIVLKKKKIIKPVGP